jgi:cytochrome c biogenesis protein ResB
MYPDKLIYLLLPDWAVYLLIALAITAGCLLFKLIHDWRQIRRLTRIARQRFAALQVRQEIAELTDLAAQRDAAVQLQDPNRRVAELARIDRAAAEVRQRYARTR